MAFCDVYRRQQKQYFSVTMAFCYMCTDGIKSSRPLSFSADSGVLPCVQVSAGAVLFSDHGVLLHVYSANESRTLK